MTGPSGNRLSICPLRFRIASPGVPIDLGCASVNRNSWGGDPESLGAYRSAYYPRNQSLFVYYDGHQQLDELISIRLCVSQEISKYYNTYHFVQI